MAAQNNALLAFFTQMKAQEGIIVEETPRYDLETYISHYSGRTRFDRLIFIGKSSVPLCIDALKAAIKEAKKGVDVGRYKEAWECIRIAAPNEPEAVHDQHWIDKVEQGNHTELQRLETELRGYKNNLIKESIRMGNEDLGKHFEKTGALAEAAEAFGRMRHDVSTLKHIMDCTRHLIEVAIQRREWATVLTNANKALSMREHEEEKAMRPYLHLSVGIASLGQGKFSEAAESFLHVDLVQSYEWIAAPSDIAMYGGLLALATMDRKQLQSRVLENPSFRGYLEYEPQVRKSISLFVNGRYSHCLESLEPLRPDLLLDLHMQRHVDTVLNMVRSKCIVQYFAPFSCVTIKTLEKEFAPRDKSIDQELAEMIQEERLDARIDAKDRLLVAVRPNQRQALQKNALDVASQYEKEAKARLRRINLIMAGIDASAPKKHDTTDEWYDLVDNPQGVSR